MRLLPKAIGTPAVFGQAGAVDVEVVAFGILACVGACDEVVVGRVVGGGNVGRQSVGGGGGEGFLPVSTAGQPSDGVNREPPAVDEVESFLLLSVPNISMTNSSKSASMRSVDVLLDAPPTVVLSCPGCWGPRSSLASAASKSFIISSPASKFTFLTDVVEDEVSPVVLKVGYAFETIV